MAEQAENERVYGKASAMLSVVEQVGQRYDPANFAGFKIIHDNQCNLPQQVRVIILEIGLNRVIVRTMNNMVTEIQITPMWKSSSARSFTY